MKITIYELLGMVKDDKLMPKKIKFENYIYIWRKIQKDYFCEQINYSLESIIGEELFSNLDLEVEILEEEKRIPEKLSTWFSVETKQSKELNIEYANTNFENMYDKINEICDYLKSKGE